jgi:hypothetical protein
MLSKINKLTSQSASIYISGSKPLFANACCLSSLEDIKPLNGYLTYYTQLDKEDDDKLTGYITESKALELRIRFLGSFLQNN